MPRMGLFTIGLQKLKELRAAQGKGVDFGSKLVLGSACGGVAAMVGVPTEVSLVRMAADARVEDPAMRRNYAGVVDAVTRVAKEEGVTALWGGAGPTVARAMLLNAGTRQSMYQF